MATETSNKNQSSGVITVENITATQNVQLSTSKLGTGDGKPGHILQDTEPIISFDTPFPQLDQNESPESVKSRTDSQRQLAIPFDSANLSTESPGAGVESVNPACSSITSSVKLPDISDFFGRKTDSMHETTCSNSSTVTNSLPVSTNTVIPNSTQDAPCETQSGESLVSLFNPAFFSSPLSGQTADKTLVCSDIPANIQLSNIPLTSSNNYLQADSAVDSLALIDTVMQSDSTQQASTNSTSSQVNCVPVKTTEHIATVGIEISNNVPGNLPVSQTNTVYDHGNSNILNIPVLNYPSTSIVAHVSSQQMPTQGSQTYLDVVPETAQKVPHNPSKGTSLTYPYSNSGVVGSTSKHAVSNHVSSRDNSALYAQPDFLPRQHGQSSLPQTNDRSQHNNKPSTIQGRPYAAKPATEAYLNSQPNATVTQQSVGDNPLRNNIAPQPIQPMVFVPSKVGQDGTYEILSSALQLSGVGMSDALVDGVPLGDIPPAVMGLLEQHQKIPLTRKSIQENLKSLLSLTPKPVRKDVKLENITVDIRPMKHRRDETLELTRKKKIKVKSKTRQTLEDTNYSLPVNSHCACGSDVCFEEVPFEQVFIRNGQMYRLPDANVIRMGGFEIYGFLKEDEWYISLALFFSSVGMDVRKVFETSMMYSNSLSILTLGDNELELLVQKSGLSHMTNFKELISTSCIRELSKSLLESNPNNSIVKQLANGEYLKKVLGSMTKCSNCGLWINKKETESAFELLTKGPEETDNCPPMPVSDRVTVHIGSLTINRVQFVVFEMNNTLYISLKEVVRSKIFTLATIQQRLQKIEYMPIQAPKEVDEQFRICGTPVRNTLWIDMWSLSSVCCMGKVLFSGRRDDLAYSISVRKWQFQKTLTLMAEDTHKFNAHFTIDPATLEILEKSEPFHVADTENIFIKKKKHRTESSDVCVSSTTEDNGLQDIIDGDSEQVPDAARCLPISGNVKFGPDVACKTVENGQSVVNQSISQYSTDQGNSTDGSSLPRHGFTVDELTQFGRPRKRKLESDNLFKTKVSRCSKIPRTDGTKSKKLTPNLMLGENLQHSKTSTPRTEDQAMQGKYSTIKSHLQLTESLQSSETVKATIEKSRKALQPGEYIITDNKLSEITLSYGEYIVPDLNRCMKQMEKGELRFSRNATPQRVRDNDLSVTSPTMYVSQLLQDDELCAEGNEQVPVNSENSNTDEGVVTERSVQIRTQTIETNSEKSDIYSICSLNENKRNEKEKAVVSKQIHTEINKNMNNSNVSPRIKLNFAAHKKSRTTKQNRQTENKDEKSNAADDSLVTMSVDDLLDRYETRMAVNALLDESPEGKNDSQQSQDSMDKSVHKINDSDQDELNVKKHQVVVKEPKVKVVPEKAANGDYKETVEPSLRKNHSGNTASETPVHDCLGMPASATEVIENANTNIATSLHNNNKLDNTELFRSIQEDLAPNLATRSDTNIPEANNTVETNDSDRIGPCPITHAGHTGSLPNQSPIKKARSDINSNNILVESTVQSNNSPTKSVAHSKSEPIHKSIESSPKSADNDTLQANTIVSQTSCSPRTPKMDAISFSSSKRVARIRKEFESQDSPDISLQLLAATATAVDEDSEMSDVEPEKEDPRQCKHETSKEIQRRLSVAPSQLVMKDRIRELIKYIVFSKEMLEGRVIFKVAKFQSGLQKVFPSLFTPPDTEQKQLKFKKMLSDYMTENFYEFQKKKRALAGKPPEPMNTNTVGGTVATNKPSVAVSSIDIPNSMTTAPSKVLGQMDAIATSESMETGRTEPGDATEILEVRKTSLPMDTDKSAEHLDTVSETDASCSKAVTSTSLDTGVVLESVGAKLPETEEEKLTNSSISSKTRKCKKGAPSETQVSPRRGYPEELVSEVDSERKRPTRDKLTLRNKHTNTGRKSRDKTSKTDTAICYEKIMIDENCVDKQMPADTVSSDCELRRTRRRRKQVTDSQTSNPEIQANKFEGKSSLDNNSKVDTKTNKAGSEKHKTGHYSGECVTTVSMNNLTNYVNTDRNENNASSKEIPKTDSSNVEIHGEIDINENCVHVDKQTPADTVSSNCERRRTRSRRKRVTDSQRSNPEIDTNQLDRESSLDNNSNVDSETSKADSEKHKIGHDSGECDSTLSMHNLTNSECNVNTDRNESNVSNSEIPMTDTLNVEIHGKKRRSGIIKDTDSSNVADNRTTSRASKRNPMTDKSNSSQSRKRNSKIDSSNNLTDKVKDKGEEKADPCMRSGRSDESCVSGECPGRPARPRRRSKGKETEVDSNVADNGSNGELSEVACDKNVTDSTPVIEPNLENDRVKDNVNDTRGKRLLLDNTDSVTFSASGSVVAAITSCSQLPANLADNSRLPIVKMSNFLPRALPQEVLERSPELNRKHVEFYCGSHSPVKTNFMGRLELNSTLQSSIESQTYSKPGKHAIALVFNSAMTEAGDRGVAVTTASPDRVRKGTGKVKSVCSPVRKQKILKRNVAKCSKRS